MDSVDERAAQTQRELQRLEDLAQRVEQGMAERKVDVLAGAEVLLRIAEAKRRLEGRAERQVVVVTHPERAPLFMQSLLESGRFELDKDA